MFVLHSRQKRGSEGTQEPALWDLVGSQDTRGLKALATLSAEQPGS